MPTGKEHAAKVDEWIQKKFTSGKLCVYIKTKHLAEDLKMKSGEVSSGIRLLRKSSTPYYFGKWRPSIHARSWQAIHPVVFVAKFLATFSPKNSRINREY